MADIERMLRRAETDGDFRGQVIDDAPGVQAQYQLSDDERQQLVHAVQAIERRLQEDPFQATEVDHGQEQGAGPTP